MYTTKKHWFGEPPLISLTVKNAEVHGTWRRAHKAITQRKVEARMVVGDSDAVQTHALIAEQTHLTNTQPEGQLIHIHLHLLDWLLENLQATLHHTKHTYNF